MGQACNTHGEMRNTYKMFIGNLKGTDTSEDLGVNENIILEWMLGN
jgi:hypothetical protein